MAAQQSRAKELLGGLDLDLPGDMEVIHWSNALEQCGDDRDFLEELLVDLWNESSGHLKTLQEIVPAGKMLEVQHVAHSIKGAAANLMCYRVRTAALYLEKAGLAGTKTSDQSDLAALKRSTAEGLEVLDTELERFKNMLIDKKLL